MSDQNITSVEAQIIQSGMRQFSDELNRQGLTLSQINATLQVLTRLEQSHTHVLEQLKAGSITMTSHENRLQKIETHLPGLLEMRRWVIGGILAGVGMMGMALFKMVLVDVSAAPAVAAVPQVIYVNPAPVAAPVASTPAEKK